MCVVSTIVSMGLGETWKGKFGKLAKKFEWGRKYEGEPALEELSKLRLKTEVSQGAALQVPQVEFCFGWEGSPGMEKSLDSDHMVQVSNPLRELAQIPSHRCSSFRYSWASLEGSDLAQVVGLPWWTGPTHESHVLVGERGGERLRDCA